MLVKHARYKSQGLKTWNDTCFSCVQGFEKHIFAIWGFVQICFKGVKADIIQKIAHFLTKK